VRPMPHRRLPSPALALRRRPRLRLALVGAAALAVGAQVAALSSAAESQRRAWGATTEVVVARTDIATGEVIDPGNAVVVAHPRALVPEGAATTLGGDRRAATPIWAGELVLEARLAPAGLSAVAARLPPGTRAVAIPVEPGTTPPIAVDDRVDVLVALAPDATGGGPPGFALAAAVVVVDVSDAAVTVALPADAAPKVAVALGQGAVTLALVGS
jgi:Flp pilus assembly protein CpaB